MSGFKPLSDAAINITNAQTKLDTSTKRRRITGALGVMKTALPMFGAGCNVPNLVGGNWLKHRISLYFSNTDTISYGNVEDYIGLITMFKTIHK